MDKKNAIETIGYILKEEKFATLEHNIVPHTFVLEAQNPFPGYHGKDLPGESKVPEFVFFVTKKKYTTEHIFRVTHNIRKYYDEDLDVARADINILNKKFPTIRIKDCKDFTMISELQSCYKSEGIEFVKSQKVETIGLVNIQKHFFVEEVEEGIYNDLDDENYFYLQIPVNLNWEQFRAITMRIKNSMEQSKFDVALGLFYRRQGIVDVVRVYNKEAKLEELRDIRDRYHDKIKKILLDNFAD